MLNLPTVAFPCETMIFALLYKGKQYKTVNWSK